MPISGAKLYQWRIDTPVGLVSEHALDDLDVEFPTVNSARTGLLNRYTYAVTAPLEVDQVSGRIVKFDRTTGSRQLNELAGAWIPGEAAFVPARAATAEDDGWLISIVTHETANAAQLLIHSASSFGDPPVAVVHLPRRVPAGFHGTWIPEP
jgi:carotenoid cleavage dioxygenase